MSTGRAFLCRNPLGFNGHLNGDCKGLDIRVNQGGMNDPKTPEDVIPGLIEYLFRFERGSKGEKTSVLQWRMTIAFRRFVALTVIVDPSALGRDVPLWKIAEALGITSARFSQLTGQASDDLGGLKHPAMRSDEHRRKCAASREGKPSQVAGKRRINRAVSEQPANRYRAAEQVGIHAAINDFRIGRPWSKKQTRLLFAAGLVDSDGILTEQGRVMMQDHMGEGVK